MLSIPKSLHVTALIALLAAPAGLRSSDVTLIGQGGVDGFVASGADGRLHVVIGGKYRQGPAVERLSAEEAITELGPVNTVRMTVDAHGRPHVVFTTGQTGKATRSYYTTRVADRWRPAEKFADAADFPERERAYVADVAVDGAGNALVCFWVSRPNARRQERTNPSFYYRWRSPEGKWSEPRSLPAHWSSAPKVECAPGGGFHLLWQSQGRDWRIAGPVAAGGAFLEATSITTGSAGLEGMSTQNEGADFTIAADGSFVVAGNVRERFEGPVGVWAAVGRADAPLTATFLGGFAGTKRGDESALHPVATVDAATGTVFVTMMNPADRRAYFSVHSRPGGWRQGYLPLLPEHSAPQGTLRQGPSVADVPGPGVVALIRDREERWYLRKLGSSETANVTRWDALGEIETLGAGNTPGIAASPDGTTHVIYMADGKIFHRQRDARGRFGPPEPIPSPAEVTPADARFNSPHLVCDSRGTLHVVFTNGFTGAARRAWYTNRAAGTWKSPVVAVDQTESGRRVNYPRLATDGTTAWIGAFAGGGSTLVKLVDLATTPRVVARAETLLWVAHPLLDANGGIFVVGRRGAAGHHLETYSPDLVATGPRALLSRGTSTKTLESTTAIVDDSGVVHVVGAAGSPQNFLWYASSARAAEGKDVVPGPELGTGIKEYTYPTLVRDARGRMYVSYRRHPIGDGQLTTWDAASGRFENPVTFAPVIDQRLRWNAPLAAAPGGGVFAVWEAEGRVLFRAIGQAPEANATRQN